MPNEVVPGGEDAGMKQTSSTRVISGFNDFNEERDKRNQEIYEAKRQQERRERLAQASKGNLMIGGYQDSTAEEEEEMFMEDESKNNKKIVGNPMAVWVLNPESAFCRNWDVVTTLLVGFQQQFSRRAVACY